MAEENLNVSSTSRSAKNQKKSNVGKYIFVGVAIFFLIAIVLIFDLSPFFIVDQTDAAVVKTFGRVTNILGPGLGVKIPIAQVVSYYYVGIDTVNFIQEGENVYYAGDENYPPITVLGSDGLEVVLDISVQAVIKKDMIDPISKQFWANQELEKWRVAVIRSTVRDIVATHKADSLYGEGRAEVETQIKEKIKDRLSEYFDVSAVYIRRVELPMNLKIAIELKLQAQQEAMKMEYVVQKEKLEADRKKIEAEGISSYNSIIAKSINQQYLQWYYVQAMDKLSQSQNSKVILLPMSTANIPGLSGASASTMPSIILDAK